MCFGGNKESTTTSNSTVAPPSWLSDAANTNLQFAKGVQSQGFTPYSGQQVAGFAPQQQQSFDLGSGVAGGVAPYVGETGSLVDSYAKAGPQRVSADTISSRMSPYMNQYVMQALQPQLQQQDLQFANQNKGVDAAATSAGAYGDTGWGQMRGTTTQAQDAARAGLVGSAYNAAFNTAIGAGAQDVSNDLNAKTTNANLAETALGRQLTGANAIYQMGTGATSLDNTLGGQQTAQDQAQKNADYNQWLMGQQYPFQTTQLMDQAVAAGRAGAPITTNGTSTQEAPDNSGFGILGSVAGSALRFVADGGDVANGQPTVVGERGPELIIPHGNGVVIPNEVLQAASMLRDAKVANGEGDPAASLHAAMQKPVRYMADGGVFGDSVDPSQGAMMNPSAGSNIVAFPTPAAAPWQNPDGPNATWQNPDNTAIPFKSMTATGGNDAKWKQFATDVGSSKTWAPLNNQPAATIAPAPVMAPPQAPMAPMGAVALPGQGGVMVPGGALPGVNAMIPQASQRNPATSPAAPPQYKFGIAA